MPLIFHHGISCGGTVLWQIEIICAQWVAGMMLGMQKTQSWCITSTGFSYSWNTVANSYLFIFKGLGVPDDIMQSENCVQKFHFL
jgi:hypothetical protein